MIGFGELRRLSLLWKVDIAQVERVYALDWILKGIFDRVSLSHALALRDAAALGKAYFPEYPPIEQLDFSFAPDLNEVELEAELVSAASAAADESGLAFRLHSINRTEARFEFTGPLGRRSAAQPHLALRFLTAQLHEETVYRPLIHKFGAKCEAIVRAASLEEMTAIGTVQLSARPRARDVFDLWFILEHGATQLNHSKFAALAERIAAEKGRSVGVDLDPSYRPLLERGWDGALKRIPNRPTFDEAETTIKERLVEILLRKL